MAGRKPPQVGTVGSTIAAGLHITIYCDVRECHHSATVDLEALSRELGPDYRIADFVARAKCSKRGAKWPKLSVKVGAIHNHTGGMR